MRCCRVSPLVCFGWCSTTKRYRPGDPRRRHDTDNDDIYWPLEDYLEGKCIGHGRHCEVRHAIRRCDGTNVAVKAYRRGDSCDEEQVAEQVAALRLLQHPCIVRLDEFHTKLSDLYVVFELLGEPLLDVIARLCRPLGAGAGGLNASRGYTEEDAQVAIASAAHALAHAHERGVAHRSVRPEALLVLARSGPMGPFSVKLAGWGRATRVEAVEKAQSASAATAGGAIAIPSPSSRADLLADDMLGLGVSTLVLLTGFRMAGAFHPPPEFGRVSSKGREFCSKLLESDQRRRLTASQAIASPWLTYPAGLAHIRLEHVPCRLLDGYGAASE